ncbi:recombinase family protein [Streptacidiphilus melanogenes]|uniref:recombinase family protein n=1 Tax=Streptacidiphilus melanogenes TaxID=411235 RepID=UPI000693DF85|nr:recombinase family protein [Streptacidiphilus melanogenes]
METTPELHCPDEWVPIIEAAMASALPHPRTAGPDSVRVGVLIRQSRAREDDSQGSPRAQLDTALHQVQSPAHGSWHVSSEHVFADIGVSGWSNTVKRPGYDAMMREVRAGKLDVVIVFALSRLSRKGALDVLSIIDEFRKHGTRLVSATEPWLDTDPSNPVGQAILGLTAALAQQESNQKSEFITGTHAQARKRGGHVTGRAPYGMRITPVLVDGVKVRKLEPDPDTAPIVRKMVKWTVKDRLDRREIAARLTKAKIPTPTGKSAWLVATVRGILRDPQIAGYSVEPFTRLEKDTDGKTRRRAVTATHGILYGEDGSPVSLHEGIISREEWWELQMIQGHDAKAPRVRNPRPEGAPTGLFTRLGILRCAVCGRPLQSNPGKGSRYAFYTCNTGPGGPLNAARHSQGVTMAQVDDVVPRMAFRRLAALDPQDQADRAVLQAVAKRFANQHRSEETREQKAAAEKELEHVQAALRTLAADREAGDFDGPTMTAVYRDSNRRLQATEQQLLATIAELNTRDSDEVALPSEWFLPTDDPIADGSPWSTWDINRKREFLVTVLEEVKVSPVGRKGNHVDVAERLDPQWAGSTRAHLGESQG